jgi:eukaryotic-like serine/threonine-protein kinase
MLETSMSSGRVSLLEGTILERRYRIDRAVGQGGFGVVYSGRHLTLDTPIAVKVLKLEGDEDLAERGSLFLDEARTLSRLRHPNIVRVLDVGISPDAEGRPIVAWLVMEWCGGRSLRDDLRSREDARTVAETWKLMRPLVDAVGAAHANGVIHRDIKPSNIMLVEEPGSTTTSARLIDFGISKRVDPAKGAGSGATMSTGRSAFTPGYAAPEQLAGLKTGPWTDVHALALLLTEMLVGEPPYGDDVEVSAIVDAVRPTPKTFGVDVGPWEAVLLRALAIKTTDRYADAGELLAALDEAYSGADAAAIGPPPKSIGARARANRALAKPPPEPAVEAGSAPADRTELGTLDVAASEQDGSRRSKPPRKNFPIGLVAALAIVGAVGIGYAAIHVHSASNDASSSPRGTESVSAESARAQDNALASSSGDASSRPSPVVAVSSETAPSMSSALADKRFAAPALVRGHPLPEKPVPASASSPVPTAKPTGDRPTLH